MSGLLRKPWPFTGTKKETKPHSRPAALWLPSGAESAKIINIIPGDASDEIYFPSHWNEIQTGDLLVSESGTRRILLENESATGPALILRYGYGRSSPQMVLTCEQVRASEFQLHRILYAVREVGAPKRNAPLMNVSHQGATLENIHALMGGGDLGRVYRDITRSMQADIRLRGSNCTKVRISIDQRRGTIHSFGEPETSQPGVLMLSLYLKLATPPYNNHVILGIGSESKPHKEYADVLFSACALANKLNK